MKRPINYADILRFKSFAKDHLVQFPVGGRLPGMVRPLDASEQLLVSYLHAAMDLLSVSDVPLVIKHADSDSFFEE